MRIVRKVLLWLLAIGFVLAGVLHFVMPEFYLRMMPPYIPWHRAVVAISGVAEIALGLAALYRPTRRLAGWGLIALLIAVFPANLYMYQHPDLFPKITEASLAIRLPFQALFMLWAWWATRDDS